MEQEDGWVSEQWSFSYSDDYGHELVVEMSRVPILLPPKTCRVESADARSRGSMFSCRWCLGEGRASSDVALVT
ncbi:hypothetical protein TNCV_1139421 [Trichonephila clavipes]|nr:hypothetical protein TNCV_1139421 [Trichonephila clavipes]